MARVSIGPGQGLSGQGPMGGGLATLPPEAGVPSPLQVGLARRALPQAAPWSWAWPLSSARATGIGSFMPSNAQRAPASWRGRTTPPPRTQACPDPHGRQCMGSVCARTALDVTTLFFAISPPPPPRHLSRVCSPTPRGAQPKKMRLSQSYSSGVAPGR